MTATKTRIPTTVAYFTVFVPVETAGGRRTDKTEAERIVARYLYNEAVVTSVDINDDDDQLKYEVLVRVESFREEQHIRMGLVDQRDRFASGMYRTTEPVVFVQSEVR